jgi:hypothetical protein
MVIGLADPCKWNERLLRKESVTDSSSMTCWSGRRFA